MLLLVCNVMVCISTILYSTKIISHVSRFLFNNVGFILRSEHWKCVVVMKAVTFKTHVAIIQIKSCYLLFIVSIAGVYSYVMTVGV